MSQYDDLVSFMQTNGEAIPDKKPVSPPLSELKLEKDSEPQPSAMDEVLAPVKAVVNDPLAVGAAAVRGVERSFVELFPGVLEHIEAAGAFPLVRGAELAAKAFVPDDMEPEFTRYKDIVAEQYLLTETLNKRAPGWDKGVETGLNIISGVQLGKTLAKAGAQQGGELVSKGFKMFKNYQANKATAKASKRLAKILQVNEGPIFDAVMDRPNEVLKMLEGDSALIDDLAEQLGDDIARIQDVLGKRVGAFRNGFAVDPTKRINMTAPVQLADDQPPTSVVQLFRDIKAKTTTSTGQSVLTGAQKKRLDILEDLLTPRETKTVMVPGKDTGGGLYAPKQVAQQVTNMKTEIGSHDAMLALDKIDELTNLKEIEAGNISGAAVSNLLDLRKALKTQIRGNDNGWAMADDLYYRFKDSSSRIVTKATNEGRVGFVRNLFGENKGPTRDALRETLEFKRYVDNRTGHADAFFSRLANIKATNEIQTVKASFKDPVRDNMHRIVQYWTNLGEKTGEAVATGASAGLGLLMGGPVGMGSGAAAGYFALRKTAGLLGGIAGRKVGISMADPTKMLNMAIKAKELSKEAKQLATDMSYVYKQFGPDGVVAMMDIVKSIPAAKELAKFGASFGKGDSKINSPGDRKLTKEDMTIHITYGGKK